jgi:hypothetical protein
MFFRPRLPIRLLGELGMNVGRKRDFQKCVNGLEVRVNRASYCIWTNWDSGTDERKFLRMFGIP